jgi:hypothetical protein
MEGPYRSYNEIPRFSSIVPVTLGLATSLTCKHVPKGVVHTLTTRSQRCHREPLLSLVNFIGILFFEQSGQLCVVCMMKKAADGITKWRVVRKWCWSVIIKCAELDTTNYTHNLGFGGRGGLVDSVMVVWRKYQCEHRNPIPQLHRIDFKTSYRRVLSQIGSVSKTVRDDVFVDL